MASLDTNSTAQAILAARAATINPNTGELQLNGGFGSFKAGPSNTSTPAVLTSGTSSGFRFDSTGPVTQATISSSGIVSVGNITAYGSFSDIKLKENIVRIPNGLEMVRALSGYTFNYIGKTDKMIGVIAQELEAVAPELVYETKSLDGEETYKAVRYSQITAILIEAIKEQQKVIENQEVRIAKLESLINRTTD